MMIEPDTCPDDLNICVIGDPHFRVNNAVESIEFHDKLVQHLENNKYDLIVCLGDILDRFEQINMHAYNRAIKFLECINKYGHTILLIGNHDKPNNSDFLTDNHVFNGLKKWKNIDIVDKIIEKRIKGHRLIFGPYVPCGRLFEALQIYLNQDLNENKLDTNDLKDLFIDKHFSDVSAFFLHQEFFGIQLGAVVSKLGDYWPEKAPIVISGHIHDYAIYKNVRYIGTPFQQSFSEPENKTISHFIFHKDKSFTENRIDLNLRKKKTLKLKISDFIQSKLSLDPNISYKIKLIGSTFDIKSLNNNKQYINMKNTGVKFSIEHESNNNLIVFENLKKREGRFIDLVRQAVDPSNQIHLNWLDYFSTKLVSH